MDEMFFVSLEEAQMSVLELTKPMQETEEITLLEALRESRVLCKRPLGSN